LLPKDIHPTNSLYFNGAYIIKALKEKKALGFMDLFMEARTLHEMPIALFALSLDWLFLASIVQYNKNAEIELCS
jgi:hypothetical protein